MWRHLHFGWITSGTFQTTYLIYLNLPMVDTVCNGLDFIYLDDILVNNASVDQHQDHLRRVFESLALHGLAINVSKCQFGTDSIDYLSHHITSQGAVPLPDKVDAIRKFTRPKSVKGLQQFAGMINFYHRFVPTAAHRASHTRRVGGKTNRTRVVNRYRASLHECQEGSCTCHSACTSAFRCNDSSECRCFRISSWRSSRARSRFVASCGIIQLQASTSRTKVQYIRPQATGCLLGYSALSLLLGRSLVYSLHGPQTVGLCHIQSKWSAVA